MTGTTSDTIVTPQPTRQRARDKMLEIAEQIVEKVGLEGLQARRIATECDCAVGTIYNHYKGGMTDLILHVNRRTLLKLATAIDAVGEAEVYPTLEAHVQAMATAYLRFALEHTTRWRALSQFRLEGDAIPPDWYRASQANLWRRIEAPIERHVTDPAGAKRAARTLFSAVHGVVSLSLDGKLGEFDCAETHVMLQTVVTSIVGHTVTESRRGQTDEPPPR